MRTAFDEDPEDLHPDARKFLEEMRRFRWMAMHIYADETAPSFTYTVGLWSGWGVPELILFGCPQETAHTILTGLVEEIERGVERPCGKPFSGVFEGFDACLFPTSSRKHADYLLRTVWFYDTAEFPCRQLVIPDPNGMFPWQDGFDRRFARIQPDLTEAGWTSTLVN